MPVEPRTRKPWLPPRWFVRTAWAAHRSVYRVSGGRVGLWKPRTGGWGALRLTTTGRRTGRERSVVLGYLEDGPNLVTLAMNGWGDGAPAWWLNLQAHPEVTVVSADGRYRALGRAATGPERDRLWDRWRQVDKKLDEYAALRYSETPVVVLEPLGPA
ncbi:nitroreductase/quinone reductase family protein [Actinoplanes sp. NPDC020271]|uniref:nitroreductase/quinone reductase family protein n=1 Tax=Actinoplanes sp. NPDC020271 TaxID=3363896 RepID=UPI0037A2A258